MRLHAVILVVLLLPLLGCDAVHVPDARPTTGRLPQLAEVPDPDETVRGEKDPPVVTLPLGKRLLERRLMRTQDLPSNIIIPTTNLSAVPITAALQAILAGTDVSLSWDVGSFDGKLVSVTNLSGPLPKVVKKICKSAKVFCPYRGGLLELKEEETFIIELPAMPQKDSTGTGAAAKNTMSTTISSLISGTVRLDEHGGNLIYTADVEGHERVQEYITHLRHGRPLIVMQLYIWEVVLNKANSTGINWDTFSVGNFKALGQNITSLGGSTAFSSIASPGVSLGATLTGLVDANTVLEFLATKGIVQTISNPQLTFISGSDAVFRVGGEKRYISEIGEASSVSGSSSGSSANTVSTESLETGLTVSINGTYENDVISAYLEIDIQDLVSLNETEMEDGRIIDLPETSERKVETTLRVRPGDNLVLAGLVTSRDEDDREGLPTFFGSIPTYASDVMKNTELVLLVKPSVVKFADVEDVQEEDKRQVTSRKRSPEKNSIEELMLDAVVVDKDGARVVRMPELAIQLDYRKEIEVDKPFFSTSNIILERAARAAPSLPSSNEDETFVDKNLLQRGFSYAFEDLLAPSYAQEGR
ncbi:MAG TPA: hypothetical protein DD400_05395 [Rhodospirillaceae bacterium]|nr:hypothetical protein [Rhodospirillaceae bacterium]